MGNLFSHSRTSDDAEKIARLENRIRSLEDLDKNQDGVVTKQELDNWLKRQGDDLKIFKEQLIQMKDREYNAQMLEYQKQIDSLKDINQKLENQLSNTRQQMKSLGELPLNSEAGEQSNDGSEPVEVKKVLKPFGDVSKAHINETIDNLLNNENVNIKYLPDFVERQLYRNMFNIMLGLLDELINKTNIEILGHEITMTLTPKAIVEEQHSK